MGEERRISTYELTRRIQALEDIVTSDRYLQDTSRNP
jgi:hypothetical protein